MKPLQSLDWQRPETLRTLVCRPALPKDTPDVMELTRTIWEGEDYVPAVWAEWLEDYEGVLAVAQYGRRVVGLCKLSRLGGEEWWLQGLRVHPEYEGRGIASHLHAYMLGAWQRTGSGVLRLATASFRAPVQHLCDRTGFKKIGEFTPFIAPGLPAGAAGFALVSESEADKAYGFACQDRRAQLTGGLMETGWEWVSITKERLLEAAHSGRLWWWEQGKALLAAREDEEEGALVISLVSCPRRDLPACLLDYRRLAGSLGFGRAGWFAPLGAGLEATLSSAGYKREWDASVYLYEKRHPLWSLLPALAVV
jgi:GNAT superfamily N-acetyltransferase